MEYTLCKEYDNVFVALLVIIITLIITIACIKACMIKLTTAMDSQFIIVKPIQNKFLELTLVSTMYPTPDWNDSSSSEEEE